MTQPRRVRRMPGGRWRLLAHEFPATRGGMYGKAHDVRGNIPHWRADPSEYEVRHDLPDTEFDELVVGSAIHIEQMGDGDWWMNIAGVTLHVTLDIDGKPKRVRVDGPGDYADPVEGVDYTLRWSHGIGD